MEKRVVFILFKSLLHCVCALCDRKATATKPHSQESSNAKSGERVKRARAYIIPAYNYSALNQQQTKTDETNKKKNNESIKAYAPHTHTTNPYALRAI